MGTQQNDLSNSVSQHSLLIGRSTDRVLFKLKMIVVS